MNLTDNFRRTVNYQVWSIRMHTSRVPETEANLLRQDCNSMMHARSGMSTKHSKAEHHGH